MPFPLEEIFAYAKNQSEPEPGVLYVVSTPIGNLEDISIRALRILSKVACIAAEDTRTTKFLLTHYGITTQCISYHSHNETKRIPFFLNELQDQKSIAIVSDAGTPSISDPAYSFVHQAIEQGIRVVAIPGASAVLTALVSSGQHTHAFLFEGFLPIKKGRSTRIRELANEDRTIVLYESPHRILRTLHELSDSFGERQVVIARELTKKFEEIIRGSFPNVIEHLSKHTTKGEFVVIISGKKKQPNVRLDTEE